jgi:branched-chain amino acid transport system substrate-binding protein
MRSKLGHAVALWALALLIALLVSSCGGGVRSSIKIGVISDCTGPFSPFYEATVAGAELPLLERGGKLRGPKPSGGVEGALVGGRRIELLFGCIGPTHATMLADARRLVERDGADVIVGPLAVDTALTLREYARRQPEIVFSIALSDEPATTMSWPARNVFRFVPDYAQWLAGLGSYAYHTLGWRTAVTVGEDDPFGWAETAGFVAEFCSLGGNVVKRIWSPFFSPKLSPLVSQIPARGVDGVFLMDGNQAIQSFFEAYGRLNPDLSKHLLTDALALEISGLSDRLIGVVAVGPYPYGSTAPRWLRYVHDFKEAFPAIPAVGIFDLTYYDAMEPVVEALQRVHGDLSHGERRLKAALRALHLEAPNGPTRLDANRQAIGESFLSRVERNARGKLVLRTFRVVPNVEETFNGYFSATTPAPSRTQPACKRGNPPGWAR